MYDEAVYAERSLRAGARGYITKQQLDETVLVAIRRLLDGEPYMSAHARGAAGRAATSVGERWPRPRRWTRSATASCRCFARSVKDGRTRQIADILHLSVKTIESHREHIKQKLGVESAVELTHRATQWVDMRSGS